MTDLTNFILERLKKVAPKDLSIDEISVLTGAHRNTVSKYVYALEKSGEIQMTAGQREAVHCQYSHWRSEFQLTVTHRQFQEKP